MPSIDPWIRNFRSILAYRLPRNRMQIVDIQHLSKSPNVQQQQTGPEMIENVEIQIEGIYFILLYLSGHDDLGNVPSMKIYFHWKVFLIGKGRWNVDV